ncbi:MAG: multicopper oxidase domain-containing protein [Gemmatimonadetes bacterium]|nr:multicopper oxidase domain-containing protein [Gemmatimonadota bacterium]
MPFVALHAMLALAAPLLQDQVVPPPPRLPLPRPVASAPIADFNQNRIPAGRLAKGVLTLALDVVEAGYRPEGADDPVVRILALAEPGKTPQVPGPLLRAPVGTMVRLTLRNQSDSALTFSGFRQTSKADDDTVQLAARATRELTFRLDAVGTYAYWGAFKGATTVEDRLWLDSQLNGAFVVDSAGTDPAKATDRIFVISEWFHDYPDRAFESALVFNGKAWPHNERITLAQGDSVRWRFINLAAIEHPLHLHGFYYRVTRRGSLRGDSAVAPAEQFLQNMQTLRIGKTMNIAWVPTTPGNWVFHCHFASHVGSAVTLHGSPEAYTVKQAGDAMSANHADHESPGRHDMHGLVIGLHVTPSSSYRAPAVVQRRTIRLVALKLPNALAGFQTAYGFALQKGDTLPKADDLKVPGPVLELRRGEPVRILVKNAMDEYTGVHWHGLEIESYPDGVPNFSGDGAHIFPPIAPGDSFAAEFTPPRSGTFPYHSHLNELRQIGSGMYGAIVITDGPRDTTRDHVIVGGGGGVPMFDKFGPAFALVNGRRVAKPIRMFVGDTNRLRLVSIHSDELLTFRLGSDSTVERWTPLARDGADLPVALQKPGLAQIEMGPGQTADFLFVPRQAGELAVEVWISPSGQRVVQPIIVSQRRPERGG